MAHSEIVVTDEEAEAFAYRQMLQRLKDEEPLPPYHTLTRRALSAIVGRELSANEATVRMLPEPSRISDAGKAR